MGALDISDVAAAIGVLLALLTVLGWLIRRWIRDQIETLIVPHLKNDEISVATYAHDAQAAAERAETASISAERAALGAKSAALDASAAARSAETAVKSLLDRK